METYSQALIALCGVLSSVYAAQYQATADKAIETPCCIDTLMPQVCKQLYNRDHERFTKQCRKNPDFSFIQCCNSCHFNPEFFTSNVMPVPTDLYQHDVNEMMLKPNLNTCFDRHGAMFCEAFVTRSGVWSRSAFSCQHSAFAFRVCRMSCGYCSASKPATVRYDSGIARNIKKCHRLY